MTQTPTAPSEPAAEGQDADVWYRQTKRLESLCLELNAELARMKAALELYQKVYMHTKTHPSIVDETSVMSAVTAALKGTSP